jgi:hypothetical protein
MIVAQSILGFASSARSAHFRHASSGGSSKPVNHLIAKHAAGPLFGASPCSWSPRARCASTAFQELLGEVDGIVAVKPERDKAARMSVASAKFESGLVFLPERAPRLADFETEFFAFPGSRHDDQGNSVSQALLDIIADVKTAFGLIGAEAVLIATCTTGSRPSRMAVAPTSNSDVPPSQGL